MTGVAQQASRGRNRRPASGLAGGASVSPDRALTRQCRGFESHPRPQQGPKKEERRPVAVIAQQLSHSRSQSRRVAKKKLVNAEARLKQARIAAAQASAFLTMFRNRFGPHIAKQVHGLLNLFEGALPGNVETYVKSYCAEPGSPSYAGYQVVYDEIVSLVDRRENHVLDCEDAVKAAVQALEEEKAGRLG